MNQAQRIFDRFQPFVGRRPSGLHIDYIGLAIPDAWDLNQDSSHCEAYRAAMPALDDEIFEWMDVLEAVEASSETFTMAELGAGYGRWGLRGGLAARQKGLRPRLRFVEAEPQHAAWIRSAAQSNGFADGEVMIVPKAISYANDTVPFIVGQIDEAGVNPAGWYGQALGWEGSDLAETDLLYFGHKLYQGSTGYKQIHVAATTLDAVLEDLSFVDLIDMDLQKAELDVVRGSIACLSAKVRRVHIATHSAEIEDEIRAAFQSAGWHNRWDFRGFEVNDTPLGAIRFDDGLQCWINPLR